MKRIISLILILIMLLSLAACGTKYPPQESTEEENRVVMTLKLDNKSYDIKYELYRAFFLTYKAEADGGNPDVWTSAQKEEYIEKIDEKIIDILSEIYSAFHLCDKIGIDIFSSSYDDEIEDYIDFGVKRIILNHMLQNEDELTEEEAYAIYLKNLKENNLNYQTHILLYRYELALEEIEEYYLGTFNPESPNPYDKEGELEYTRADVEGYYNSDASARIIEAFISCDAGNAESRAESLREKMIQKANAGKIDEMISAIAGESLSSENEIKNGIIIGKYELNRMYYKEYTDVAFRLEDTEVSEVIEIDGVGYYIIYKCEKSSEYLESNYTNVEVSYCGNEVSKIREQIREGLASSASKTDIYTTISHSDIKM